MIVAMRMGWRMEDPAALTTGVRTSFWINMIVLAVTNLAMIAVMWWLIRRRQPNPAAAYFPAIAAKELWLAIAVGLVMAVVLNGLNEILSDTNVIVFRDSDTEKALVPHGAGQFLASVAVISLIAPLSEELLFRGLLFRWLAGWRGQAFALVVSAVIFGLMHGQFLIHPDAQGLIASAELIIAGAVLAALVVRTGSLRASFATHAAYNLGATLFSVLLP
jgi:membrane protease YdiL (CAAX protease family)